VVPVVISAGVALIAIAGLALRHAELGVNRVALADAPRGVTVVEVANGTFRAQRHFVGTLAPWLAASVGPQFVAAYVSSVLVRPGASVHRGEVVATLDCRDASARSRAIAAEARSLEASQAALAAQATRVQGLLDGGFVAANEVQMRTAESVSEEASVEATRARLANTTLAVNDCVLRAPFDGDVGARQVDPGAFVRPGSPVVTVVDRAIVRLVVDVPETDFDTVAPGTPVRISMLAVHREVTAPISRRSPSADPGTRTVHVEIDLPDPERRIPVNTTAELRIDVGEPATATIVPLSAASVRGDRAELYLVDRGIARRRRVRVLGEIRGDLYVDATALAAGSRVVTEGRATLADGDRVAAHEATHNADASP
jgi:RND family efflux transporter MFP subunit